MPWWRWGWRAYGALVVLAALAGVVRHWSAAAEPPAERLRFISGIDGLYAQVPAGPLFLRFEGLDPKVDGSFIYEQFMRATYRRWPQPVYVGQDTGYVRDSAAILAGNDLPPAAWCRAHQLAAVLTFAIAPDGSRQVRLTPPPQE